MLHAAAYNACIVSSRRSLELSLEDWERVLRIDLCGGTDGVRSFPARLLAMGEEGHVVNVSSSAAVTVLVRLAPNT